MNLRIRRVAFLLASTLATLAAFALLATPALALKTHRFSTSFGASGSGAGQLSLAAPSYSFDETGLVTGSGLAINDETGNVYVADTGNHRVEEFSSTGTFIRAWGWGVATGASEFQICTVICQIGISGSAPGQFESPLSIAIDNSGGASNGDVYIADTPSRAGPGTELIQKFDPSGNLITGWANGGQLDGSTAVGGPFSEKIAGIATDESGNLFVNNLDRYVFEFAPDGTADPSILINGAEYPAGIGADPSGVGNLYWTNNGNGTIDRLDSVGSDLGAIEAIESGSGVPYQSSGFAVDPSTGDIYSGHGSQIRHFAIDSSGAVVEPDGTICAVEPGSQGCPPTDIFGAGELSEAAGVAVDGETHDVYVADPGHQRIAIFRAGILADLTIAPATGVQKTSATLNGHLDPDGGTPVGECDFEYVTQEAFEETGFSNLSSGGSQACDQSAPISSATDLSTTVTGLTAGTTYRARIAATNEFGPSTSPDQTVRTLDAVTAVTTEAAANVTNAGADLRGSFTGEEGLETKYFFEYGTTTHYDHKEPVPPATFPGTPTGTETQEVGALIESLVPGTAYHYRIVAENKYGITPASNDETFTTEQPPTIEGFFSSDVTATTAVLHAQINPQVHPGGVEAECRFEFGTTTAYGQSAPCPEKMSGTTGRSVKVDIENLQPGVTYHFRLIANNKWGSVTSEDQNFEFFPPACPNSAVREQTGSAYLPDCRAYELVSPGNANGTLLYSGGPNTGQATGPSRFSFVGAFSSLPGTGEVIGTGGDLYVSTRTDTGWVSKYIGLPGNQAGCMTGPPNNPWSHASLGDKIQNFVSADPAMSRFLDFNGGASAYCIFEGNGTGDANKVIDPPSSAPYLWSSEGALLAHLPTALGATPGAAAAFACPYDPNNGHVPVCSGDVAASSDLTHLVFSSSQLAFAPGGLTAAPGSAYDDNLATGKVELISKLPGTLGEGPIPQDPTFATTPPVKEGERVEVPGGPEEFIRFPAVSTDGSRILMSTATAGTGFCNLGGQEYTEPCPLPTDTSVHLYMRVNDLATYEIAESPITHEPAAVNYVGDTPDASRIYFTSEEHLTHEDEGHGGASLFVWSAEKAEEGKEPLTLISKADPGSPTQAGDTEECEASWTTKCGVLPYSGWAYAAAQGGLGGNGISDSAIAQNGDIYFYSPEQLDGDRGVPDQQNLYDYHYREGRVQFVAAFAPGHTCALGGDVASEGPTGGLVCSAGPIARLEVSADDSHMAFVTADQVTSYDNTDPHGSCQENFGSGEPTGETHCTEMYSYTPATGSIVCDSCNPDGQPPTTDVWASQDGLFMTEDGRTFFSTTESLVPSDTNRGIDVYEFVDGRPQLITPGTGTASVPPGVNLVSLSEIAGFVGVSANGTDVYFSTYDTLTSEDHNGDFLKFYDARTNGGFPQPPPTQPCVAAEECHGPGTEAPTTPQITSNGAPTKGGNATPEKNHARRHKKHKRAKHKRHHTRAAKHKRGGAK